MGTAGSIVLDLLMRTGSFETDTQRAARTYQRAMKDMQKQAGDAASGISNAFKGLIGGALFGITAGSIFGKFITETRNAQGEQAQLAAVLASTGEAAGFSAKRLNEMAAAFAGNSTFSEGDINKAQTRLLSYTGVVGEEYPRALQAAIDMSARLGTSLEQSSETIGKALDVPSQGMAALSKQGFRFSDDQKKLVERLEETGKTAQAQGIILAALESSYGGAAAAARDTLGGALEALGHQLDSLMTGEDGTVSGLTRQVNDLTEILGSDSTRQSFADFTSWIASVSTELLQAVNSFNQAIRAADGWIGAIEGKIADSLFGDSDPAKELEVVTKRLNDNKDAYARLKAEYANNPGGTAKNMFGFETPQNYESRLQVLDQAIKAGEARLVFVNARASKAQKVADDAMFGPYLGLGETGGTPDLAKKRSVTPPGTTGKPRSRAAVKKDDYDPLGDFIKEQEKIAKEYESFIGEVTGRTENAQLRQRTTWLEHARDIGEITSLEFEGAITKLFPVAREATDQLSEFTLQAARDIQTNLGDSIYSALTGQYQSIGDAFKNMLLRMASDIAASQINKLLLGQFGADGGKGKLGGLFGLASTALSIYSGFGQGGIKTSGFSGLGGGVDATNGLGLSGWDSGGFTGPGGRLEPAGIVHRGEGVLSQDDMAALGGVTGFNALRRALRGRGYDSGGAVGSSLVASVPRGLSDPQFLFETHGVDLEVLRDRESRYRIIARQEADSVSRGNINSMTPSLMAGQQRDSNSRFSKAQAYSTKTQRKR